MKREIRDGDENMGTLEAGQWRLGDRVDYPAEPSNAAAWARVSTLLRRRALMLVDDGAGYTVVSQCTDSRVCGADPKAWNVYRGAAEGQVFVSSALTLDAARRIARPGDQIQRGLDGEVYGA